MPYKVVSTERLPIKSWATDLEAGALDQAKNLANLPFAVKWVALMSDCHPGFGMPIGGVLATDQVIIPNAVGVDIGCGMQAVRTSLKQISQDDLKSIMGGIRELVPLGFNRHKERQDWTGFEQAPEIEIVMKELESSTHQLGTLGGGNHFIEIQQGSDGYVWLVVHSGSRNLGLKVATDFHKKAVALCQRWYSSLPDKDLSFFPLDSEEGQSYLYAMNFCLAFARANRNLMMKRIKDAVQRCTGADFYDFVDVHHNYAALENHFDRNVVVHRKGAIRARLGEPGIIPGSMGTSSYLVGGLGNPESFTSCSHGAGRRMGRKEAIRSLSLEEEQSKMEGVLGAPRTKDDLDEAPGAYKDIDMVMEAQTDLVVVRMNLKPLAVIKG